MKHSISPERQVEIITQFSELAEELGWIVSVEKNAESVPGLILGTQEFSYDIIKAIEDSTGIQYETIVFDEDMVH